MKIRLTSKNSKMILCYMLIFWLIICSGSQYFRIFHSSETHILFFVLTIVLFFGFRSINKGILLRIFFILMIVSFNQIWALLNGQTIGNINNIIILLINLFALLIIHSSMTANDFKKYYIYCMMIEAIISLLCFAYITILNGNSLPFQYSQRVNYEGGYNIIYLTFYYTLGWLSTNGYFHRNAGIFWEPGAHAIFLNLAIFFMLSHDMDGRKEKKFFIINAVLILSVLSTESTTGYMCLAFIFIYAILKKKGGGDKTIEKVVLFIVVLTGILITVIFGDVFDKLIYGTGSYNTRANDAISGLIIALQKPVLGQGLFSNTTSLYASYGVTAMSNGLISLLASVGIPICILYLIYIYKGIKKFFNESGVKLMVIFGVFILFFATESITLYPLFLSFLIPWKNEDCMRRNNGK